MSIVLPEPIVGKCSRWNQPRRGCRILRRRRKLKVKREKRTIPIACIPPTRDLSCNFTAYRSVENESTPFTPLTRPAPQCAVAMIRFGRNHVSRSAALPPRGRVAPRSSIFPNSSLTCRAASGKPPYTHRKPAYPKGGCVGVGVGVRVQVGFGVIVHVGFGVIVQIGFGVGVQVGLGVGDCPRQKAKF